MSKLKIIEQGSGHFIVEGDLTFSTLGKDTLKSFDFLKAAKEIIIDLGRVTSTDSAGLALMMEWIKYSRRKRIRLSFKNIPEQLLNLAKLSGLDKALELTTPSNPLAFAEH
ncbi:Anti-sigma-factor antagonist [Candidatus Methylobacter favarea]|uniref:Anti-sigma-factor antagonist n=1 Tax=Candidatus Methylobacter favarea TaxID=2707345 RepID=A0A8S0WBR9_9GAMM|nr:STAS domain-containing protein [Candidatus Methylobacter favarea]CAA9891883.1 Anti-sigma-factor antagonist [Candidatus Methylobacter favarea]